MHHFHYLHIGWSLHHSIVGALFFVAFLVVLTRAVR